MRDFAGAIFLVIIGGAGSAFIVELAPLPALRVAAALGFGACVYFAGRIGAPGAPGLAHLFGVLFAVLGLAANWAVSLAAASEYDIQAALDALGTTPDAVLARLKALSVSQAYSVGGREIAGDLLLGLWAAHAVFALTAGLFGGQSAYELWSARRGAVRL